MKKHTSQEAFYARLRNLADVNKTLVSETNNRSIGTLVDFERAANGVAYGIIKEQHKYYIKKGGLNENQTAADFAYIGGIQNITDYQYGKLAEARKIRNMLLKTVNEGFETKVNSNGSKKMLTEDKASQEIDMAASKVDSLDAATAAAAAPAPEEDPLNTDGEAEMDAGIEAMNMPADSEGDDIPADVPADAPAGAEMGAEIPIDGADGADGADGGEIPIDGAEGGEEVALEDPESEATREIEKNLGKLTNTLRKTELTEPQVKSYVNSFLSAFKDDFPEIDIEDRKEMAEKITKVVPDSDIEDLGQNVEDTEGNPEMELEEAGCDECGGFAKYAESRGYTADSVQECDNEEMTNLVSGYANAHGEGQNDGDFKAVALFITPEIIEKLKSEYGHEEFADEVEPFSNEMNETSDEDKAVQIAELFGGLGGAFDSIKKGVGNAVQKTGQNIKQKTQQVGQNIAQKAGQVQQGVKQAATNVKQGYHAGEVPKEVKKLEDIAANLGQQIDALNKRLENAGKEPVNVKGILSTIANKVSSANRSADLSQYTNEEGIPADSTEVQPMMEEDNDDDGNVLDLTKQVDKPEPEFGAGFESMGGAVVKPDGAETTTVEITKDNINVTLNEVMDSMSTALDELSTGLARQAGQAAYNATNQSDGDPLERSIRQQQTNTFDKYINPEIVNYFKNIGVGTRGVDEGIVLNIKTTDGGSVQILVKPDKYEVVSGKINTIDSSLQRKLSVGIKKMQQDLAPSKAPNELEEMNESEIKLRKYIRNRLQEHAGIKKVSLNENKKSNKLQKLDKMIDKQFHLYETVMKNKIKIKH